jgi:hypothetical protein
VYRYIDPSHVGILDMDASSASDPGMSGMICPMAKLHGSDKSFSEYEEPNEWRELFAPYRDKYKEGLKNPITINGEEPEIDYMKDRDRIVQEELDINRIRCPIINATDPNIVYTHSGAILNKMKSEKHESLFTIVSDSDADDDSKSLSLPIDIDDDFYN